MTFIDATVVNVALPALQADLHATITDVQWVIEAYALFLGALILVGGSMGRSIRTQARVPRRRRIFHARFGFVRHRDVTRDTHHRPGITGTRRRLSRPREP